MTGTLTGVAGSAADVRTAGMAGTAADAFTGAFFGGVAEVAAAFGEADDPGAVLGTASWGDSKARSRSDEFTAVDFCGARASVVSGRVWPAGTLLVLEQVSGG